MSLSALRRALPHRAVFAASSVLAVAGTLAIASSASAMGVPTGSSSDPAYSGTGTPSSLYSIYNAVAPGLYQYDQALQAAADTNSEVTGVTSESDLNSTNVPQIVADFTDTTFEGVAPSGNYTTALAVIDPNYSTDAAEAPTVGETFLEIDPALNLALAGAGSQWPNGLFSIDNDLAVSSALTVTKAGAPSALSITLGTTQAAAGGIVVPSAFSVTIPSKYDLNLGLAGKEIPQADVADPTKAKIGSVGTVTVDTPALIYEDLGTTTKVTGQIYAVEDGSSATDVAIELYFDIDGLPVYAESSVPSSLGFPLKLSFGEFNFAGTDEPLPMSSLTMSFPAKTSAVEPTSCKSAGTITAAATDNLAALAYEFGDTTDGYDSTTKTAAPVNASATATKVADKCPIPVKLTVSKTSVKSLKGGKPSVKFSLADSREFNQFAVTVPKGFKYSKLSAKDVKISGAKVKSVKAKGTKLTVTLKSKTRKISATVSKGIVASKSAKKDKKVTLKISASGKTVSVKVKA